jgi:hypothetical protein
MTQLTRIPYDASSFEVGALSHIKDHLQLAFGKHNKVTTADALSYAVLIALETLEETPTYLEALPYEHTASQTRLARFLVSHPSNANFDADAPLDDLQIELSQKLKQSTLTKV